MWDASEGEPRPEWREVETDFDIDLFGVVQTVEGPYAVGDSGTLVADRGDGWEIVFDDGPATREAQLRAAAATSDGRRVWMVGTSGVVACYDVEQRRKFDYSYPDEMTSTWEAISVAGPKGQEKVLAANGSGEVLPFVVDGFDVNWGSLRKPAAKGANIAALAATPDGVGFAIDTSGNAFRTSSEEGWERIGVLDSQVKLHDVWAGANQRVYIAAGDGRVYRYDDSYEDWTPIGVADGVALRSIDVEIYDDNVGEMVVIGDDGNIYQRLGDERWVRLPSPTTATLLGLSVGGDLDVAVGKGGTVIERPQEPRNAGSSPDGDQYDGRGENYDQPTDRRDEDGVDEPSNDEGTHGGESPSDGGSANDEGPTREKLLLLLASGIDVGELSKATGYDDGAIEETLVDIADEAGADPAAFRKELETGNQ